MPYDFENFKIRALTSVLLLFLVFLILKSNFVLIYSILVLSVFSILEFLNISKSIFRNISYYIFNFFFILFISFFSLFFFFFSIGNLQIVLFIILLGCIASDIGGFIFGNLFKGPKLTKISPNKTLSGSIGSFFLCCVIVVSLTFFFTKNVNFDIFVVSILTSLSCQLGDLFFSYLKRKAKIKDYSNILPGHGGVIDRLDGIFFWGTSWINIFFIFCINMKKNITILGSTGSIGLTALSILEKKKKYFKLKLLSANKNYSSICKQIKKYKPNYFLVTDFLTFQKIKKIFKKKNNNY